MSAYILLDVFLAQGSNILTNYNNGTDVVDMETGHLPPCHFAPYTLN